MLLSPNPSTLECCFLPECQVSVQSPRCRSLSVIKQKCKLLLLLFTVCLWLEMVNNVRKGAANLGAMHFTSPHALIKALTSVGHTKEGSYLHTHATTHVNTHTRTHTHTHTHTHTFDSIIIEPTSRWIWVTGARRVHILWCVIRLLHFLECAAIQEGNFRLAKSYREDNLAPVSGYYRVRAGFWTRYNVHVESPRMPL